MMLGHLRGKAHCPGSGLARRDAAPYDTYSESRGDQAPSLADMLRQQRIANSQSADASTAAIGSYPATDGGGHAPRQPAAAPPPNLDATGCTSRPALTLTAILVATLPLFAFCSRSNSGDTGDVAPVDRCSELKQWYADNPGDSNVDIAKDYWLYCREAPPPVISGELSLSDIS